MYVCMTYVCYNYRERERERERERRERKRVRERESTSSELVWKAKMRQKTQGGVMLLIKFISLDFK